MLQDARCNNARHARPRTPWRVRRGPAMAPALALLLLATSLVPAPVAAYHAADDGVDTLRGVDPDDPVRNTSTIPTVEQARDDLLAAHAQAVAQLNALLAERGIHTDRLAPAVPARVFHDDAAPDGRIGGVGEWSVVGGHWRIAPAGGWNGSAMWTMTNASTGRYATMDALVVTPEIDLSAYPISGSILTSRDGTIANAYNAARNQCALAEPVLSLLRLLGWSTPPSCAGIGSMLPPGRVLQDQINLVFRHTYNFAEDLDGAQVVLYTRKPTSTKDPGYVLEPMNGFGSYNASVAALQGSGFSSVQGWQTVAFDVTPWAGQSVWIGFRVATSAGADATPTYFPRQFKAPAPYGWIVDDVEIFSPAYGQNLKVHSIVGPSYRTPDDPRDPHDRVALGATHGYEAVVLNAGGSDTDVRVSIEVEEQGNVVARQELAKTMVPGEVWRPSLTHTASLLEGMPFTITACAWSPSLNRTCSRTTDATPVDNVRSRTYVASSVQRVDLAVAADELMVDDHAPVHARVLLRNTGNVPLDVNVSLAETHLVLENATTVTHAPQVLTLAPGQVGNLTWRVTSGARGEHVLRAVARVGGADLAAAEARYYVHASPPPIFADSGAADAGWSSAVAILPEPQGDDWMWVARPPNVATLHARPLPRDASESTTYQDLRLHVRYMPLYMQSGATVQVAYTSLNGLAPSLIVWERPLPAPIQNARLLEKEVAMSWQTAEFAVVPEAEKGYMDLWSLDGLEVRVVASLPATANNASGLFVDELRLTGVPTGQDASQRRDLVHLTGSPSDNARSAEPSSCFYETVALPAVRTNCWRPVSFQQAALKRDFTRWSNLSSGGVALTLGEGPALWRYHSTASDRLNGSVALERRSDRLVTPVLEFRDAHDAVLSFAHSYAFPSWPDDTLSQVVYHIAQAGFVEIQWRKDDGTWSEFRRILPQDDYPHVLAYNDAGDARNPSATSYRGLDGFYYPGPCVGASTSLCNAGDFRGNIDVVDGRRAQVVKSYPALEPHRVYFPLKNQSALQGVDLSNREVRFGFRATTLTSPHHANPEVQWTLADVRVTPVSQFAIDAAATHIRLELPYDWRAIGVGPGTEVPVNVTIRNVGKYAESFDVKLQIRELNGGIVAEVNRTLGTLDPDDSRFVIVPWQVGLLENRAYEIRAIVVPTSATVEDENPYNDVARLGRSGELVGRTHVDVAVKAAAFPETGRETLARYLPIVVHNLGNVPVRNLYLTRSIERLSGGLREQVAIATWTLGETLSPSPEGVPFERLKPRGADRELRQEDLFFTPGLLGTYVMTVGVAPAPGELVADNNVARTYVRAREALSFNDFEAPVSWETNDPAVWGRGDGFRSSGGILAANRTSGAIPPGTDAWIETPLLPLANAQAATINVFTRHDLEHGYDGARVEVSVDGRTWHPVPPVDASGRPVSYPVPLIASNPLADGAAPDAPPRALSGSTRDAQVNLDGWIPATFDLGVVPGLYEDVVFRELAAPNATSTEVKPLVSGVYLAPWMVLDPADPAGRWEIRNETERIRARSEFFWWSGYAHDGADLVERKLFRSFNISTITPEPGLMLVLSWWEWRAGSANSSWEGIGDHRVSVYQKTPLDLRMNFSASPRLIERVGEWSRVGVVIDREINFSRDLWVEFVQASRSTTVNNLGWAVEDIDLRAVLTTNGTVQVRAILTQEDEAEAPRWLLDPNDGWQRARRIPPRAAPWTVVTGETPDGGLGPMWRLALDSSRANLDTRLVTPAVDLSEVAGTRARLRVHHAFDLAFQEGFIHPSLTDPLVGKYYQAGTVEIQILNRTTGDWDPWRQLFAHDVPSRGLRARPANVTVTDGLPYNATLPNAGDTFERYPREYLACFGESATQGCAFYRKYAANTSYVFSGNSGSGFVTSEFDLSPYVGERVRFAFHAWSGASDPSPAIARHWTLGGVEVVASVLSTDDARVRFRLGTDSSILSGSWALDQFEVAGIRYGRSVGIELDAQPIDVAPDGHATIRGTITNYGPSDRQLVALGLRNDSRNPFRAVRITEGPTIPGGGAYAAIVGPFDLKAAGQPNASATFELQVDPGILTGRHQMILEALDGTIGGGGLAYAPVEDDVPGRAKRQWALDVRAITRATVDALVPQPPYLDAPGQALLSWSGTNTGNVPLVNAEARFRITRSDGTLVGEHAVPLGNLSAGARFTATAGPIALPAADNYTLTARLLPLGTEVSRFYRVGRDDVVLAQDFESGWQGWTADAGFRLTGDEAKSGATSVLFGLNNTQYYDGEDGMPPRRLGPGDPMFGRLTSPPVDLRSVGPDPVLGFWHKPRFGASGAVTVDVTLQTEGCTATLTAQPYRGRASDWQFVAIPLQNVPCSGTELSLAGRIVTFRFTVMGADDQGWRLDGVTIASGNPRISPQGLAFPVSDSALKQYPFRVENPGLVAKEIRLGIDPALSKLTDTQREWLNVTPDRVRLEPGASQDVVLTVATPAARGAFPQLLDVALATTDLGAPLLPGVGRLSLDFRPLARHDFVAVGAVGGSPLGPQRKALEEGVPHEISAIVRNDGLQASRPTTVLLRVVEEATGNAVWEHREAIDALAPYAESEQTVVVSGSWKPDFGKRGNHTLRVVVDPDRQQVDYDRANDDLRLPLDVVRLIRPDVVVDPKALTVTTPDGKPVFEAVPGQLVRVEGLVTNVGFAAARDVTVRLLAGNAVLKEELVPLLKPGDAYRIHTNQFAPSESTTYRILAFTPDLELASTNNERSLDLPVFPPEIQIGPVDEDLVVEPGVPRTVLLRASNSGPYPVTLNLTVLADRDILTVASPRLALGPHETRDVPLQVAPSTRERAGPLTAVLRAEDATGLVTRRTIVLDVAAHPAAEAVVHRAGGPPQALRVEVDLASTGNTELRPTAVVLGPDGAELARAQIEPVPAGKTRFAALGLELPPGTAPGRLAATLLVEADGQVLARVPFEAQVEPWSRTELSAHALDDAAEGTAYALRIRFDGNAPAVRQPVLYGVPEGVRVRFDERELVLQPGETREVTVRLEAGRTAAGGLYHMKAAVIDPAASSAEADVLRLATVPLDLRRPDLALEGVARKSAETVGTGDEVRYVATLRNVGDRAARDVPVSLYVDGLLVARETLAVLAPGQREEVALTWTATAGMHAVVVAVDPDAGRAGHAETLRVEPSLVEGAKALRDVPAPGLITLVLLAAAVAAVRRRGWR